MKKNNLIKISEIVLLLLAEAFILVFINFKLPYHLDSDMSAELILGRLLSDENRIVTDSWYYSTEIRVFHIQIIYLLLFKFIKSWKVIRLISCFFMHAVMTLSAWYLCREMKLKKQFPLTAISLLMPMSSAYYLIMLVGCYYIPHVSASFITLGAAFAYIRKKGFRSVIPVITAVLALAVSLNGVRMMVVCYAPFLAASVLMLIVYCYKNGISEAKNSKEFKMSVFSAVNFLFSAIGCAINSKILAERYTFKQYDSINFTKLNINRAASVLNDFLVFFGYSEKAICMTSAVSALISGVLFLAFAALMAKGIFDKNISMEYKFISVFTAVNILIFSAIYIMSDMEYTGRYNIPILAFSFPIIFIGLNESDFGKLPDITKKAAAYAVTFMIIFRGGLMFNELRYLNRTLGIRNAAEFLENSGYDKAYATYWDANVVTELSNGKIEMYSWYTSSGGINSHDEPNMSAITGPDTVFQWLQKKDHDTPPSGKIALLFKDEEIPSCLWKDRLSDENIIYSADGFTIYGYEDMKEILTVTPSG